MTGQRQGYLIALVVAVLALVVSLAAAMTVTTPGNGWHMTTPDRASSPDGWRQGLAGGGMMGTGTIRTPRASPPTRRRRRLRRGLRPTSPGLPWA